MATLGSPCGPLRYHFEAKIHQTMPSFSSGGVPPKTDMCGPAFLENEVKLWLLLLYVLEQILASFWRPWATLGPPCGTLRCPFGAGRPIVWTFFSDFGRRPEFSFILECPSSGNGRFSRGLTCLKHSKYLCFKHFRRFGRGPASTQVFDGFWTSAYQMPCLAAKIASETDGFA